MGALFYRPVYFSQPASSNPGEVLVPIRAGKGFVGGWDRWTDGQNWLTSTKAFDVVFSLSSFGGTASYDWTDPDGTPPFAFPGENPTFVEALIASNNQAKNDVWRRINHAGALSIGYSSGSFSFFLNLSFSIFQSTDDDKCYIDAGACRVQLGDSSFSIDTSAGGTNSGVTVKIAGGEGIPLPIQFGTQTGTVKLTPTAWWS